MPYHLAIRDHLREHVSAVFEQLGSDELTAKHAEELDLSLLKATYRLEPESHPTLYGIAAEAAERLDLEVQVDLYRGTSDGELNAALYYAPGAARVVLYGPLEERLERDELLALFGHELAHHLLFTAERGELFTATRALHALDGAEASSSVLATARMWQLTTETFADRGGWLASGSADAVIRCLLKTQTGSSDVDAQAYLAQAEEVLERAGSGSEEFSHPETFLRAKALSLYASDPEGAAEGIARLLEGQIELDALDLIRRVELTELSRDIVDHLLAPRWFRTAAVIGHARLLFDDYDVKVPARTAAQIAEAMGEYGETVHDYLSYLMLDFVAVDPSLEELPIAQAQWLAEPLGLLERLEKGMNKELKITKRVIKSVRARQAALLAAALAADTQAEGTS